jgi:hypothetical protein
LEFFEPIMAVIAGVRPDRILAWARTQQGETAFAAAWSSGAAMGLEQAVAYAFAEYGKRE